MTRDPQRTDPSVSRPAPRETVEKGVTSPAEALDARALPPDLEHSFENVRIHRDGAAAESARALGATAYTYGSDIVFGPGSYAPDSAEGRDVLLHELGHVAQTGAAPAAPGGTVDVASPDAPEERAADRLGARMRGAGAAEAVRDAAGTARPRVYRRIVPEDVASEMVGQEMTVATAFTATQNMGGMVGPPQTWQIPSGAVVRIVTWDNALPTALVSLVGGPNAGAQFDIPKTNLRPRGGGSGLDPYGAGVAAQAAAVERGEQAIARERARPGGPRPGEIPRLEGLQRNRQRLLNRRLIQGQMLNRFDASIRRWVDHYSTQFPAFTPRLDPDLVKSMLFQESQMGTSGQHLEDPPSHPVKTRFNLGQVIDSSAQALLIMMREVDPTLITTHHLTSISTDLSSAQAELRSLRARATRTPAEEARLAELVTLSGQSWEVFMWSYRATGQSTGFREAVDAFFAAAGGGVPRNMDYDFWIRAAVRWLFEKRRSTSSWAEAIRAYNGSGARARHYRDAVLRRASDAEAARAAGTEFVPAGL